MQWMVDEKELRVIHYTLGPLKPWDWSYIRLNENVDKATEDARQYELRWKIWAITLMCRQYY